MNRTNKLSYGTGGLWKKPKDIYVGIQNVWKRARSKLVGVKGKWVEVFDGETVDTYDGVRPAVHSVSPRALMPYQPLTIRGEGLSKTSTPFNKAVYFFKLDKNLTEHNENTANAIFEAGSGSIEYDVANGAVKLDSLKQQNIRIPTDSEGGFDLRGLAGINTPKNFMIGIQFMLDALPPAGERFYIVHAGILGERIAIYVNSSGKIGWFAEDPIRNRSYESIGTVNVGEWCGVLLNTANTVFLPNEGVGVGFRARSESTGIYLSELNGTEGLAFTANSMDESQSAFLLGKGLNDLGQEVYMKGRIRNFLATNIPDTGLNAEKLMNPSRRVRVGWWPKGKVGQQQPAYNVTDTLLQNDGTIVIGTPASLAPGLYDVAVVDEFDISSPRLVSISPFSKSPVGLDIDFSIAEKSDVRKAFVRAHKAWGGLNGGVIGENVHHVPGTGVVIKAQGDLNDGPQQGVDRFGVTKATNKRIGGCIVTRDYYGPGSYEIVAKLPILTGVVSAFWTFHYEEADPGTSLHTSHLNDGLHQSGSAEDGFYTVRNHEIDIEIPTALKGAADMEVVDYKNARFNTWRGELRDWDLGEWSEYTDEFVRHGVAVNDGNFHKFRFDWHLGADPRVEFYIDDVLVTTNVTHVPDIPGRLWIGLWFPSSPGNHWAGKNASFIEEEMVVRSVKITPYESEVNYRLFAETYGNDGLIDFFTGNRY